jgi:hypothetical protein
MHFVLYSTVQYYVCTYSMYVCVILRTRISITITIYTVVFCTVPGKFFCHFKNFHDKDLLGADAVHRPILQYCIPIILLLELLTIDNYPRMRKRNKIYYTCGYI